MQTVAVQAIMRPQTKEVQTVEEKLITVEIGGYQRFVPESRLEAFLDHMEDLKQEFIRKGTEKKLVEDLFSIRILKDEK